MNKLKINEYKNIIKLLSIRIIKEKQMRIRNYNQLITYSSDIAQKIFRTLNSITLSDETIEEIIDIILKHIDYKSLLSDINQFYNKRFWNKIRTKKQLVLFFKENFTTTRLLTNPLLEAVSPSKFLSYCSIIRMININFLSSSSIQEYIIVCLKQYYKIK